MGTVWHDHRSDGVGAMQNGHGSQLASQCGKSVALQ